jgi:DNA-binding NarL/FixJ family response regulator
MIALSPLRILLVDDHSVVRLGFAAVLGLDPSLKVVAEASDAVTALEKFREQMPDVTLLDLRLPGMGGLELLKQILQEWPEAKVVMLTSSEFEEDAAQALTAGAVGYLIKGVKRAELSSAIHAAYRGERFVSPSMERLLQIRKSRLQLSARELEVLDLMRQGLSNAEISWELKITEHTAKAHVRHILAKFDAPDRARAVAIGYERGLLRPDRL